MGIFYVILVFLLQIIKIYVIINKLCKEKELKGDEDR